MCIIINLRRSRDGTRLFGCLCLSDPRFIQFALASCYTVHINALYNESIHRKEEHASSKKYRLY